AMAAELGNMRVTEQIDALVTMAVSPVQYLLSPRLLASVLMMPLLCIVYTCVGMAGAYLVAVNWMDVDAGLSFSNIEKHMVPRGFGAEMRGSRTGRREGRKVGGLVRSRSPVPASRFSERLSLPAFPPSCESLLRAMRSRQPSATPKAMTPRDELRDHQTHFES